MTHAIDNGPSRNDQRFAPCGSHPDAPWLCVYTKPAAERIALQELRQQSFPAYLPLHLVTRPNRETRIEPIFSRYIFAQPFNGSWSAILGTRGVSSVLRTPSGSAQEVPRRAVERLLACCAANGVIYPPEPVEIAPGDALRATTGPFAEWTGVCTRTAKDRIWLLMEIMGRPQEIAFARTSLEPA